MIQKATTTTKMVNANNALVGRPRALIVREVEVFLSVGLTEIKETTKIFFCRFFL